jgi:hypothetical protein
MAKPLGTMNIHSNTEGQECKIGQVKGRILKGKKG